MAKDRFTTSPFPAVQVSKLEQKQLEGIVRTYVEDYINKYVEFVVVDKRRVDKRRWEHVKTKDNPLVYAERTRKELRRHGVEPENSLNATQRVQAQSVSKDLPVVLSTGTLIGELDNLMYGVLNPTLDGMRIKASYVHAIDNAAVLCPVVSPTKEDPFRSLIVKWMSINVPLPTTKLVKSRDFVFVEATGFTYLPNGDRVGYHLLHSIDFPQTKALPNKIRGNLSAFSCFRRKNRNNIEAFAWGVVDPGGDIMRSLAVSVAANALLSATSYVHCGHMKKLAWMLQRLQSSFNRDDQTQQKQCVVCNRKTSSGVGGVGKGSCRICSRRVCFSCKSRHRMSFITPDGQLLQRKVVICGRCINDAAYWNAQEAASDEATDLEACTGNSTNSAIDTSASSLDA
jgi:hypothetical protein